MNHLEREAMLDKLTREANDELSKIASDCRRRSRFCAQLSVVAAIWGLVCLVLELVLNHRGVAFAEWLVGTSSAFVLWWLSGRNDETARMAEEELSKWR